MKYDTLKPWIKITIPVALVLVGLVIGYFVFKCEVQDNSQVEYIEEDLRRVKEELADVISEAETKDSIAALNASKQDSVIIKIKQDAKETISKGVDVDYYNTYLIPSNRARGEKHSN